MNTASGTAKRTDSDQIAELFRAAGLNARVVPLHSPQNAIDAARASIEAGDDAVVAAGGDGTVSTVASTLVGTITPLGVLPLGTLNHFAKDLGIPTDLEKAIQVIAARRIASVDVGEVNDRFFVNNSSIGVYPSIVEAREELKRLGHRKWPAFVMATVEVIRHYRGVVLQVEAEGRLVSSRTPFVFVGNNEYVVEGVHLGGRTRLDSGQLFAYLAPRLHATDLPKLFFQALVGRLRQQAAFESFAARELRIQTDSTRTVRVAIDGEVMTMTVPLHFTARPAALKVIVPPL